MIRHVACHDLLDFVCCISTIVDYMMDLLAIFSVDVSENPIDIDICLDPPTERETVALLYVDKTSFRGRNSSGSVLDSVHVGLGLLGLGLVCGERKLKRAHGGLQSIGGLDSVSLPQCRWSLALVERITEREHLSIAANVDVEIGIVDVQIIDRLFEVEVRNAVVADVMIVNETEGCTWDLASGKYTYSCIMDPILTYGGLYQLCSSIHRVSSLIERGNRRVRLDGGSIRVLCLKDLAEGIEVYGSLAQRLCSVSGMTVNMLSG